MAGGEMRDSHMDAIFRGRYPGDVLADVLALAADRQRRRSAVAREPCDGAVTLGVSRA